MRKSGQLMRFGVSMEGDLLEKFDSLCAARGYTTRSEAIRDMIREGSSRLYPTGLDRRQSIGAATSAIGDPSA